MISARDSYHATEVDDEPAMNLTPMLDIMFILLVFFLLTIGTVLQSLEVDLPSTGSETAVATVDSNRVVLEIGHDGYRLDGHVVADFEALKTAMAGTAVGDGGGRLIVAADKDIAVERFLDVMAYLRSAGIEAADVLIRRGTQE